MPNLPTDIDTILEDLQSSGIDYANGRRSEINSDLETAKQAIALELNKAKLTELRRLSDYYMRHDGEGEHKLASEIIEREAAVQKESKEQS